jgi:thioredoxin reductase (NADPH)
VLDDLLEEWRANIKLPYEGIRVAGTQWSPRSHDVKDFLARHQIAYQWLDIDRDPSARSLVEQQFEGEPKIPVIFLSDGKVLIDPEIRELADKVGFKTQASLPSYDIVIVGAALPGWRLLSTVHPKEFIAWSLRKSTGGQAGNSPKIENYLGFPTGLSGMDLARRAVTQAKRFGAEIISTLSAESIRIQEPYRIVCLSDGTEVSSKAVLIATGAAFRRLEVPGVDKLTGAGVYYGAAYTEAMNYIGQPVFIVGGANSAGQGAMFLSRFASKVTMLIRRDTQWSSKYLVDAEAANPKIERLFNTEILEIRGVPGKVEEVAVINRITNETKVLPGSAVFIFIGAQPQAILLRIWF